MTQHRRRRRPSLWKRWRPQRLGAFTSALSRRGGRTGRCRQIVLAGELGLIEARVKTVAGKELGVLPGLDDAAAIQYTDQISTDNGREAVRNDNCRAALHQAAQCRLNLPLRLAVERRRRFVEQQDRDRKSV